MRHLIQFSILACLLLSGCATTPAAPTVQAEPVANGVTTEDGKTTWYNGTDIGTEGQGWSTGLALPYDRFPAEAEGKVSDAAWGLSRHSAGISIHFETDSPSIAVRWSLRNDRLSMPHMPTSGVSGVDLYVKHNDQWGWLAIGIPDKKDGNEAVLASNLPEGFHEYRLYLPLYNGIDKLEIGVQSGATLRKFPTQPKKPVLIWGSSIVHGACASRPGMAYPSIIGRRLNQPMINLGFSGNGLMDPPITELIAKLDVAAYVIDCCPNMAPELIAERTEPLVNSLRAAHPDTPIVLVENVPYAQGWFLTATRKTYEDKNAALRGAYERLLTSGVKGLHYIPCDRLFGDDHDATVDGVHPNDLGFERMADVIEPVLRDVLR